VTAANLGSGLEVSSSSGGWLRVTGATWRQRRTTVFNFEVADFHTYFVGEAGAWVHNVCRCGSAPVSRNNVTTVDMEGNMTGGADPLPNSEAARPGNVKWVPENPHQSPAAAAYAADAPGAQPGKAPALTRTTPTGEKDVRFDGFIPPRTMVDRKLSVTTFPKAKRQAVRQSEALEQHNMQGRWQVPNESQAERARRIFDEKNITNIQTEVVPVKEE
jgi:hypothetical protein